MAHFEFPDTLSPVLHEEIRAAVIHYMIEKPPGMLYFRIILFSGAIVSDPPLVGPLCEVRMIGFGGKVITTDRPLLLHRSGDKYAVLPFQWKSQQTAQLAI